MCYPSCMRILPLTLCALLLQVPAKADKFWLTDPDAQKGASEGSSPNIVEGVLIAESDEGYHVRIVGGEVLLPKKSVFKIEKDGLSIDAIVKVEQDQAKGREAADQERQLAQAATRRARVVKAVEASVRREVPAEPAPAAAAEQKPKFDPVLDALPDPKGMKHSELQREVQLAYALTKDHRYLKVLRQLRRLR